MHVDLRIYKVSRAFAEIVDTRYIAEAHQFGTPEYRWFAATDIVEIHERLLYCGVNRLAFTWSDAKASLEAIGGFEVKLDLDESTFTKLFGY